MKELDNIKEVFDIFVDSCEKAGVKFSKEEEKQVEEWPKVGDDYWYFVAELDMISGTTWKGDTEDLNIIKNLPIFKTETVAGKYYSIIDTINNIVDELGRPSWDDFEKIDSVVYGCGVLTKPFRVVQATQGLSSVNDGFFPSCKTSYLDRLLEKVSEEDLLWAFKKSMGLESC